MMSMWDSNSYSHLAERKDYQYQSNTGNKLSDFLNLRGKADPCNLFPSISEWPTNLTFNNKKDKKNIHIGVAKQFKLKIDNIYDFVCVSKEVLITAGLRSVKY